MQVNREQLGEARRRWRTVAIQNGWVHDFDTADFTVWVDADGNVTDSVATRTGGGRLFVELDRTGEPELEDFES